MPPIATKKPVVQPPPDPTPEPIQASAIVVIHPGSQTLRLGRAADTFPTTVPHCIARRHLVPGQQTHYEDPWLMHPECTWKDIHNSQKQALLTAEDAVRVRPKSLGEYRQTTTSKQLAHYNCRVTPEKTDVMCAVHWTNTQSKPKFLIGQEALYVNPSDCYNLHWPMRNGQLNVHSGPGGSLTAILQDVEDLWGTAIQSYLDIPLKDLKHYRVVLLIPDIYNRWHVKELMELLINRLGFAAAIVHQESVCATFGAGLSSACVVDVGDQKTAVCCVEDGMSMEQTRVTMNYGGRDITRLFHWLLCKASFPYKECQLARRLDALLMQELKQTLCHLDQDQSGYVDHHFQLKQPDRLITKYSVRVGDEAILAPMAVFFPDLFSLQSSHLTSTHRRAVSLPEDQFDGDYLKQTQSNQEKAARLVAAKKKERDEQVNVNQDNSLLDDSQMGQSELGDDESNDQVDSLPQTETMPSGGGQGNRRGDDEDGEDTLSGSKLLGLDQAVLHSIERCDGDDVKKRMYSCILVVGGGLSMFLGAHSWLQYRVWMLMPAQMRILLETMDVITRPKDMDPQLTCWKGATILSCLDTTQELWVRSREWNKYGVRVLRERAPFNW